MRRLILSVCLLIVVVSCARLQQRSQERQTDAAPTVVPTTQISATVVLPVPTTIVSIQPRQGNASLVDARTVLEEFMQARIDRDDAQVKALMTPELQINLDSVEGQVPVFQLSNPCWYRYEILQLAQPEATAVDANVRIYEHYWSGDSGGGPPDSFDQSVALADTPDGWRVSALGKLTNQLPQPNEPHGQTLSACNAVRTKGPPARGDFVKSITVNGTPRAFRLHVPTSYRGDASALVLNFHGYGSNGTQQENLSGMSVKADQSGFIVAYPEGMGEQQHWGIGPQENGQADMSFVRALIQNLSGDYATDAGRIYATGISNGAEFSNLLACQMADTFSAVASVAGGYFRVQACKPTRPVASVEFHGTDDRLLPYAGDGKVLLPIPEAMAEWAARNGCASAPKVIVQQGSVKGEQWSGCRDDADVVLYTINGGGHSWPGSKVMPRAITTQDIDATDVMWEFFASHSR